MILNIDEYRELLEKAEDLEALKALESMRREPMEFRRLDDFLSEFSPTVLYLEGCTRAEESRNL